MIVALAGRRVKNVREAGGRFQLDRADVVRDRIAKCLQRCDAHTVVSSAACGADLLAHEVARELRIHTVVVLPFPPAVFRPHSVTDCPGNWGPLFDSTIAGARGRDELIVLDEPEDEDHRRRAYARTNEVIVDTAVAFTQGEKRVSAIAVAVWDGLARPEGDMTAHFIAVAEERGLRVEHVSTL